MIDKDRMRFWVPLQIEKAKSEDGTEEMKIKGVASTSDKDADDENLDPMGFDLSIFKSQGYLNWHHKASTDPSMIVGEPTKAQITKKGLEIEGMLYNDSPTAKSIFKLAQVLEKNSKTRRLGFSIEGKALERDPLNPKKVTKALITGCAITFLPKNPNTIMNIVKGDYEDLYMEKSDDDNSDLFKDNTNQLSKSQMFERIFQRYPDLPNEDAEILLNSILNNMKNKKQSVSNVADEEFAKALDVLGLNGSELQKGQEDEPLEDDEDDTEEVVEDDEEDLEKDFESTSVEDDETEEDDEEKDIKKGGLRNEDILKAIEFQSHESTEMFKAIGTMMKKSYDRVIDLESRLEKAIETISDLQSEPVARKSAATFRDKNFEKGIKDEALQQDNSKTLSFSRQRKQVLDLIEVATFEKGYDPEFGAAMTSIEAGGIPSQKVLSRLKSERGIDITA